MDRNETRNEKLSEPIYHQNSGTYFRVKYTVSNGALNFLSIIGDYDKDDSYETDQIDFDRILKELLKKKMTGILNKS